MTTLHRQSIEVAGLATRVITGGSGTTPMVLLGGGTPGITPYCGGSHLWGQSLQQLAKQARVIALDFPGSGGTMPAPEPLTVASFVAHIGATLGQLGVACCHLVGHDLGALIALSLAIEQPQLAAAITVVASPAAAPSGDVARNITFDSPPEPLFSASSQRWALERISYSHHHVDDAFIDQCVAVAKGPAHQLAGERMQAGEFDNAFAPSINQAKARLFEFARTHGFTMPVQLIWGSHDPLVSLDHGMWLFRLIAAKQRATHFHLVNRAGNLVFRDDPQAFARLIGAFREGLALT